MNLFKKIFGIKDSINLTSFNNDKIPLNAEIVYESQVPEYCSIGNLIFEKKFDEAIVMGNKLLKKNPKSSGVHVNLMDAYFKIRNENPLFFDKSIEHARLAMLYGHNTGYVQERLVINLEKSGKINQAIQVCNIVLLDEFQFSSHGCGNKEEFTKRKEKLTKKLSKSKDSEDSFLFRDNEISLLIKHIQIENKRILEQEIEQEKRMKILQKEFTKRINF